MSECIVCNPIDNDTSSIWVCDDHHEEFYVDVVSCQLCNASLEANVISTVTNHVETRKIFIGHHVNHCEGCIRYLAQRGQTDELYLGEVGEILMPLIRQQQEEIASLKQKIHDLEHSLRHVLI